MDYKKYKRINKKRKQKKENDEIDFLGYNKPSKDDMYHLIKEGYKGFYCYIDVNDNQFHVIYESADAGNGKDVEDPHAVMEKYNEIFNKFKEKIFVIKDVETERILINGFCYSGKERGWYTRKVKGSLIYEIDKYGDLIFALEVFCPQKLITDFGMNSTLEMSSEDYSVFFEV